MNQSRRRLLQTLGATTAFGMLPPVEKLVRAILSDGLAYADSSFASTYIAFSLFAAPNRWLFDHWMKTKPSEAIVPNPMIVTRFSDDGKSAEYATVDYKGIEVPFLWNSKVKSASGGLRPMSDLLDHMVVFRGYGTGVDGHASNHIRQYAPIPSLGSITGYVSDESNLLLRGVQYGVGSVTGYRSMAGNGITSLSHSAAQVNLLNNLLRPFTSRPELQRTESLRARHEFLIERAANVFKAAAESQDKRIKSMHQDQGSALKRLRDGVEDLNASWSGLFQKYWNIVTDTYRDLSVQGLTAVPLVVQDESGRYWVMVGADTLRPTVGSDLRGLISNGEILTLVQGLALAEFVASRKLASGIEIGLSGPTGLRGQFSSDVNKGGYESPRQRSFSMNFDEHTQGQMTSLLLGGCYYRALAAGVLELVDQLKSLDLFSRTVLHFVQEFGRAPRNTANGSDHSFDGMIASAITGRRQGGPLVIGNIKRDGTNGAYAAYYSGTIGYKAPTQIGSQSVVLTPAHVASSVAMLLGFTQIPWANTAQPLVKIENSNVVAIASGDIV